MLGRAAATAMMAALWIGCWCGGCRAYRILAYEPSVGHSHWNVMSAVLESLVDAGHVVVCATVHPATGRLAGHPNYTHVDMAAGVPEHAHRTARDLDYAQLMSLFRSNAFLVRSVTDLTRRMCRLLFEMPGTRRYLVGGGRAGRFDAVVVESLHSECGAALPRALRVPAVYVVPCPPVSWMPAATGSPDSPSYLGALLADRPTPVTFRDRLANALVYVHTQLVRRYHDAGSWVHDTAVLSPSASTGAVVLINTHHSIEPARSAGPNVVDIGGIHLRPAGPIPRDLAQVLDDSDEFGVIVFSFGSLVALNSLPEDILDKLKSVFRQLPQTIIWKYENDHMPDKPDNVVLYKWLPQRAILQHPNVKVFISHGGLNGVYEAVDGGVPILGIPLFFDQPRNIQNLVDLGMALSLKINEFTEATLYEAINRLIEDQNFSENAKRVSTLFKDRPMSPSDSAVYWIEYLIRHGSEANVTPPSADASWTVHFMVDQLFVALSVLALALWCSVRVFRYRTSIGIPGK
ncbi:UDP-glucuronosyltransferase 2B1-like isoform X2 [Sipha flava]|uniref:UDP-glucuronosyltransferase n=1 Tax=Sipha flava TaxID=143950 RepID=A0A8B8FLQ8_9HEMI|nr:UDP-glucuronosyltransferase 2B1-like isoform X2 [Sipha flava]